MVKGAEFDMYSFGHLGSNDSSVGLRTASLVSGSNFGVVGQSASSDFSGSLTASNHHAVLDHLQLGLSLPLYYHPHHLLSQKYTKTTKDLLEHREDLMSCFKILGGH